jgi:hypothetical protein
MRTPAWNCPDTALYLGDAADVLRELPTGSVDCVVTSLPLTIGAHGNGDGAAIAAVRRSFSELRRVVAADSTVWLHLPPHGMPTGDGMPLRIISALARDGWHAHRLITLCSDTLSTATIVVLRKRILCRSGSAGHASACTVARAKAGPTNGTRTRRCSGMSRRAAACRMPLNATCRNRIPRGASRSPGLQADTWSERRRDRPLRFDPLSLETARRCIAAGSPPDGTVLDLNARGGLTGVAARQLGRRYIGVERHPGHLAVAVRRLGHAGGGAL